VADSRKLAGILLTLRAYLGIFRRFDKSRAVCEFKSRDSAERFLGKFTVVE